MLYFLEALPQTLPQHGTYEMRMLWSCEEWSWSRVGGGGAGLAATTGSAAYWPVVGGWAGLGRAGAAQYGTAARSTAAASHNTLTLTITHQHCFRYYELFL